MFVLIRLLLVVAALLAPRLCDAQTVNYFTAKNNQILDPSRNVWSGRGLDLGNGDWSTAVTNAKAQPLTTLFPNINFLRFAVSLGSCTYDFTGNLPAQYDSYISAVTALGIVVLVENHAYPQTASDGVTSCSVQTGTQLTAEEGWYAAWAKYYLKNPYVWFGTPNEPVWCGGTCSQTPVTTEEAGIYNAIRTTAGSGTVIILEPVGGGILNYAGTSCSVGYCLGPESSYSTMHNVAWDFHIYSGSFNNTAFTTANTLPNGYQSCGGTTTTICTVATMQPQLSQYPAVYQEFATADGVAPTIIGEFGPSNIGLTYDTNGLAVIQTVIASGMSGAAWHWGYQSETTSGYSDILVDNTGALTTDFGSYVAAWTKANTSSGVTKPPPPAPLTGTVTTQSWTTYDQAFTTQNPFPGIKLPSGKSFHFQVLPPAQYTPSSYAYPLLIWLHDDGQGNCWYQATCAATQLSSAGFEAAQFNTVNFLTTYPAIIAVPYADTTTDVSGNTVENWGGWANNGTVGSVTNASGDTGPNTFAVMDMISYLETQYSIDPGRIYVEGFGMGGIGAEYLMQLYNEVNGTQKIFTAGASMGGVLEINGLGAGPTLSNANTMLNVPVWWFSGSNDTFSKPGDWNTPIAQKLGPSSLTISQSISSIANSKVGNSQMEYTLCPTCGHQDSDASGVPVWTNPVVMNWMFGITSSTLCQSNCTPVGGTSWDPNQIGGSIQLSNANLTATSGAAGGQTVRSNTSQTSGKWCAQITLSGISGNIAVGVANANDFLTSFLGGSGAQSIGLYPEYDGGQQIYLNGAAVSSGTAGGSLNFDVVTIELDATNNLVWFTDNAMKGGGYTWNNSPTANPETGTGGLSTSSFGGPYFLAANTQDAGDVWTLNPTPTSGCTASFSNWQISNVPSQARHPLIINLGQNDNWRVPSNDNQTSPLYIPASYSGEK